MAYFQIPGGPPPPRTTFKALVRGSSIDAIEPERITITAYWETMVEWDDALPLVTHRWHVHQPLGGSGVILDVVRGAGLGTLSIESLGNTDAILVELRATEYLPIGRGRIGVMGFIRTTPWIEEV